ncbi:MAG: AzlD domain-containing protein [Firmicutes bacterium]|nr:AzlD domain-containing protein [Bacillota bacterium]
MELEYLILVVLAMMLVTYPPRALPLVLLSGRDLPGWLTSWLGYVPVAVISALLAPGLLIQDQRLTIYWQNPYLLAAIPTFLAAIKTRNLFISVLVGMLSLVLVNRLLG